MRKLKIFEHISLDGVIQHSNDYDGFPYGDWSAPYRTPEGRDAVMATYGQKFDLLLGRTTYDIWSGYWPKVPASPMANGLNAATKFVVTHRPETLAWGPAHSIGGNVVEKIQEIKLQDGPDVILNGSSSLTSMLLEHGVVDEICLFIYPLVLGTGKRFFREGTPARSFELIDTKITPTGIILNQYRFSGPLKKA